METVVVEVEDGCTFEEFVAWGFEGNKPLLLKCRHGEKRATVQRPLAPQQKQANSVGNADDSKEAGPRDAFSHEGWHIFHIFEAMVASLQLKEGNLDSAPSTLPEGQHVAKEKKEEEILPASEVLGWQASVSVGSPYHPRECDVIEMSVHDYMAHHFLECSAYHCTNEKQEARASTCSKQISSIIGVDNDDDDNKDDDCASISPLTPSALFTGPLDVPKRHGNEYLKDWHFQLAAERWMASAHGSRPVPKANWLYSVPEYLTYDWLNAYTLLRESSTTDDFRFVYAGKRASWTPLHMDVLGSYSWSLNLRGKKYWRFYPAGDASQRVCALAGPNGDSSQIDHAAKDLTCIELVQETGDIVFVPSAWYHQVHNLEPTISVNHNWINAFNAGHLVESITADLHTARKELADLASDPEHDMLCQRMLRANCSLDCLDTYMLLLLGASAAMVRWLDYCGPQQALPASLALSWPTQVPDVVGRFSPSPTLLQDVPGFVCKELQAVAAAITALCKLWLQPQQAARQPGSERPAVFDCNEASGDTFSCCASTNAHRLLATQGAFLTKEAISTTHGILSCPDHTVYLLEHAAAVLHDLNAVVQGTGAEVKGEERSE